LEIRTIEPFLRYFGQVRERTMRVASLQKKLNGAMRRENLRLAIFSVISL
jgi:hypothetical protein